MCLRPIRGSMPPVEVLAGEKLIEVAGNLRQREGMVVAADAAPQIAQADGRESCAQPKSSRHGEPSEALGLEELAEDVLEHVQTAAKPLENAGQRFVNLLVCRRVLRTSSP